MRSRGSGLEKTVAGKLWSGWDHLKRPGFHLFLFLLFLPPPSLRAQPSVRGLFRPSEKTRLSALGVLLRRGGPSAGPDLVRFLGEERSARLRRIALDAIGVILPTAQAGALDTLARKEKDPALKRAMLEMVRKLRLARELEKAVPVRSALPPSPGDLKSLVGFVGRRRLEVRYLGPRRKGERVLVRVWSPRLGLWLPSGKGSRGTRGSRFPSPAPARAGGEGRIALEVPGGALVAVAWTPRALAWEWVPPSAKTVRLEASREKWGDLGRWKGQKAFLEAWPSGPWPSPGFPAWRIPASGRFRFFGPRENRLDLLVRIFPRDPGGETVSRHPGLLALLRGVGPGKVRVGGIGTLSVSGTSRRRIGSLWVDLSPGLRPDLSRRITFPPGGGLLALTEGPWKAALGWKAPGAGTLFFHPRGLRVEKGRRLSLSTLPLRTSVYSLIERRLGAKRNVLTVSALFRTPGGSVLRLFVPEKGKPGVFLRAYRRIVPLVGVETDRLCRAAVENCGFTEKESSRVTGLL